MTIEHLRSVIHPPERPEDAFDGPWEEIEALLHVPALPADYKDLCREYGYLHYFQFMSICIPKTKHPNLRLESIVYEVSYIQTALGAPRHLIWPAPGSLLPFGGTDNGDYLFWLTRGHPDEWGVVVWDEGFGDYEFLECDLTDFLAGLATGAIRPQALPDDLSGFNPVETSGQLPSDHSCRCCRRPADSRGHRTNRAIVATARSLTPTSEAVVPPERAG